MLDCSRVLQFLTWFCLGLDCHDCHELMHIRIDGNNSGQWLCPCVFSISSVVDVGRSLSVLDFGTMSSSLSIRSVAIADSGFSGLQRDKTRTQRVCSGQLNCIQRSVPARVRQTGEQLLGW